MERLNDIMGRATLRRPQHSEQRSSIQHNTSAQEPQEQQRPQAGAEAGQPSAMRRPSRPPLREQMARQGQQRSYIPQGQPMRPQSGEPAYSDRREGRSFGAPSVRASYPRPTQQLQQRPATSGPSVYPQARQESQATLHPLQTRPTTIYQHEEDYALSPMAQADVAPAWEDDEDDTTGMQYGDWEEDESEVVTYQHVNEELQPAPTAYTRPAYQQPPTYTQHPLVTRELTRTVDTGAQGYGMRQSREARMPNIPHVQPAQSIVSSLPPVPLSRTQEVQHHHRMTQPLNPRVVEAARERQSMQEAHMQPAQQRPIRQVVSREQPQSPTPPMHPDVASMAMLPPVKSKAVCPKCHGAGYLRLDVPFGHPNFGKPVACECKEAERKEKRRQQLLELSDLDAFYDKSFKNFNTRFPGVHRSVQEAFQEAYSFAQDPEGWLVLIGPNGCGKTHLAAAIANQCLSRGSVVLFTVVPDFLAHLRATFSPNSTEAYDQRFSKMREAEVLVLDDLGAHQSSPWASEKLFQLLNYRYNSRFPTVITANKQGLASVDERILSRLSDIGLVSTVTLTGAQDYRRQNVRRDSTR